MKFYRDGKIFDTKKSELIAKTPPTQDWGTSSETLFINEWYKTNNGNFFKIKITHSFIGPFGCLGFNKRIKSNKVQNFFTYNCPEDFLRDLNNNGFYHEAELIAEQILEYA